MTSIGLAGRIGGAIALMAAAAMPSYAADNARPPAFAAMLKAGALVKGGSGAATWAADGRGVWYRSDDIARLIDRASGKTLATVNLAGLRPALVAKFGDMAKAAPIPLDSLATRSDGSAMLRWLGAPVAIAADGAVTIADGATPVVPGRFKRNFFMYSGFSVPDMPSPDGSRIASVDADGNIVVRAATSTNFAPITRDAETRYGWDIESGRLSIGSIKPAVTTPWSPDGTRLFAMRIDRRATPQIAEYRPLNDPLPDAIMRDWYRAGGPYYSYAPAIISVADGRQVKVTGVDLGTDYVLFLAWASDGRTAYFARFDRGFGRLDIIAADGATGAARIIMTERDKAGLRVPHQVYYAGNIGFQILPANRGFLLLSERDGWQHLYHFAPDGKLVRQLTRGDWRLDNILAYDPATNRAFVTGRPDRAHPYDVHVLAVPLAGGGARQLTEGHGLHEAPVFSPDMRQFVDSFSSPATPPRVELRTTTGTRVAKIDEADISALLSAGWQAPIEFTVKAADGKSDVHGVMYRPFNFDPAKKWPVVEDIYGGPQVIWADHEFLATPSEGANLPLALAQAGYLVVKLDTPGTPGRSRAFQMAVLDRWGPGVAEDHAAAIRNLAAQYPFVDASRVGIFGHSWGGYNALMALATQDGVYDAAVATAPGVSYGEQRDAFMENYLGSPKDNPAAWARADLFPHLGKIRKPLMTGAGTQDYALLPVTIMISKALMDRGFQHEFVLAPGQAHGIYGTSEAYFIEKTVRFFETNIPAGGVAR